MTCKKILDEKLVNKVSCRYEREPKDLHGEIGYFRGNK
jgi:hypothetical protein